MLFVKRNLTKRKVKLEFSDNEGANYSISLEGSITKDKILKVAEVMELISGSEPSLHYDDTVFGRICKVIQDTFPLGSFTSNDILETYEDTHNSTVKISTVSTYLARLANKGLLKRQRDGDIWIYRRIKPELKQH